MRYIWLNTHFKIYILNYINITLSISSFSFIFYTYYMGGNKNGYPSILSLLLVSVLFIILLFYNVEIMAYIFLSILAYLFYYTFLDWLITDFDWLMTDLDWLLMRDLDYLRL